MIEKLCSVAEKAAICASRRAFLGKLSTTALSLAATMGGLLAMPQIAHAASKKVGCCKGGHCVQPAPGCVLINKCVYGGCIWNCNGSSVWIRCEHKGTE